MGVLKLDWLLRMEGRCLISRKIVHVVLDPEPVEKAIPSLGVKTVTFLEHLS
jgi:hypothetical protein